MPRPYPRDMVVLLARAALAKGARVIRQGCVHWDASADCSRPVHRVIEGRSAVWGSNGLLADMRHYFDGWDRLPIWLEIEAPCRKCPECLRRRARHWTFRARSETSVAARTWFGTLTLSAEHQSRIGFQARHRLKARGVAFDELSQDEQFKERHREICVEVTKWLKRVRKESLAPLRYILVAEAHKSGLPHYHLLVHQVHASLPVQERTLRRQWKLGHSKFTLVHSDKEASYVCKYLSKSSLARVRASVNYGKSS